MNKNLDDQTLPDMDFRGCSGFGCPAEVALTDGKFPHKILLGCHGNKPSFLQRELENNPASNKFFRKTQTDNRSLKF